LQYYMKKGLNGDELHNSYVILNNVLAFPNIFRGALDVRASDINKEMKLAAALAIADIVKNPTAEKIIPDPFDPELKKIAKAVAEAAVRSGVARIR